MRLARLERATSASSDAALLPMHSSSSPPPSWLWRGIGETANPPCGGRRGIAPARRPEERDLFTTAKLASRTGERAKSETPRGLSALRLGALPLSYSLSAGGIRTRDTRVANEVSDLFTTGAATVLSGNGRERAKPRHRRTLLSEPATRQPSRGQLHGTMHAPAGFEPAYPERSIRALHHRQIVSRGTAGAALVLETKNSAPSPPGILKTLLHVSTTKASERPETKTPPEHRLGRGSKIRTFRTGSTHSASARKRAHVAAASP